MSEMSKMKMFNIFFENNGRIYCRKCIAFSTKTVNLKSVKNEKYVYHLKLFIKLRRKNLRLLIEISKSSKIPVLKAETDAE